MNNSRILIDVKLQPSIGSRFQPTGFPDLGHAEFLRPIDSGTENCLLVESPQSMANHLEGTAWDDAANAPVDLFDGMPYVRVLRSEEGDYLTSSRTEAHRLASAFVKGSTLGGESMVDVIRDRLGLRPDTPIDHRRIARALFQLDPFVLLHGVFFADKQWPGQPKIARAVSSFIEASGVLRADSGGVKKDAVRHSIGEDSGGSSEGYGTVPFARTEWSAREIVASFNIDRKQIHSYGLGAAATALLENIALWEIRTLLDDGLRLRTACDLAIVGDDIVDRSSSTIASADELAQRIRQGINEVGELLGRGEAINVVWDGGKKQKKAGSAPASEGEADA